MSKPKIQVLPEMTPRDILSPTATLMGFIIASISFIITYSTDKFDSTPIISILLIAIFFILSASFLTVLSSMFKSETLWRAAKSLYAAGWFFFILILLYIGYMSYFAGQIEITLPELDNQILLASISLLLSFVSLYKYYSTKNKLKKDISDIYEKIESSTSDVVGYKNYVSKDYDIIDRFIRTTIALENLIEKVAITNNIDTRSFKSIREIINEMYKRRIITQSTKDYFHVLWNIRNKITHGGTLLTEELQKAAHIADIIYGDLMDTA